MARSHNFSAGPTAVPLDVLTQAHEEFFDFAGTGMSVMEISHRSQVFMAVASEAERDLRDILGVPPAYKVLFLQGGASLQFAQVPMNLIGDKGTAGLPAHRPLVGQGNRGCPALLRCARGDLPLVPHRPDAQVDQKQRRSAGPASAQPGQGANALPRHRWE